MQNDEKKPSSNSVTFVSTVRLSRAQITSEELLRANAGGKKHDEDNNLRVDYIEWQDRRSFELLMVEPKVYRSE